MEKLHSKEIRGNNLEKINSLNPELDFLSQPLTRRRALATGGKVVIGAAAAAIIAAGGTYAYASQPRATETSTATSTAKIPTGLAALGLNGTSASAGEFFAFAGTTFILVPVPGTSPLEFTHTVDGVVQVSPLGDCTVHFDLIVTASGSSSRPFLVTGTQTITTADGASSVTSSVNGYLSSNPANATFLGIHYELKFTGGTGQLAGTRGHTVLQGFAAIATNPGHEDLPGSTGISPQDADLIAPPTGDLTGKACWVMQGSLELPGGKQDD